MNFEFSEEQDLLREQARSFLKDKSSPAAVREILESDKAYDQDLWKGMVELGWPAALIPEAYGGLGLGYLELCVLAEELGASLAPTPFASSVYLATVALLMFGDDAQKKAWLPRLAAGQCIGTLAVADKAQQTTGKDSATRLEGDKISGTQTPVIDGDIADFAVVLAAEEDGSSSLAIVDLTADGVHRQPVKTLDPTRSHAEIRFTQAAADRLIGKGQGQVQLHSLFDRAAVLMAFEQVGGAQACLDMAREYAMQRFAFGRPIASFQAIKHKLVDMYIQITLARSNCYYGAWALSTQAAELPVAAAAARVSATEAFHYCSKENIQVHGGMGFTWEFDCHLYYRRSKLLALNLGSLMQWKDRLIASIETRNSAAIDNVASRRTHGL